VLFVLWTYVLLASGAGSGPPDLNRLAPAFTISAEKVSGLVLATLFVGLFLHPLQFGMTRLLEGYWGVSSVALSLSAARINHHRAKARDLNDRAWMHKKSLLELTALQAKLTRKDEGDSKPSQASLLAEAKQLLGSCLLRRN